MNCRKSKWTTNVQERSTTKKIKWRSKATPAYRYPNIMEISSQHPTLGYKQKLTNLDSTGWGNADRGLEGYLIGVYIPI